jgi:hypothetical protein
MSGVSVPIVKGAGLSQMAQRAHQEHLQVCTREELAAYGLSQKQVSLGFTLEELAEAIRVECKDVYGDDVFDLRPRSMAEDAEFDARVIRLFAKHWLPDELGTDPRFWNAFALMFAPRPVYGFRHAPVKQKNPKFNTSNLVSHLVYEHYYGRQWMRLAMTRDENCDLDLGMALKGSSEFWRSHVFRQKAVWSPTIVRSFLNYQYAPDGQRTMSESSEKDKCDGIRLFIKHLVSSTSRHCLDILDEGELKAFYEGLVSAGDIELLG